MTIRRKLCLAAAAAAVLSFRAGRSLAADNPIEFAPPPIVYPEFSLGEKSSKISPAFLHLHGAGYSLTGLGGNYTRRTALKIDKWAYDWQAGAMFIGGKIEGYPHPLIFGLNGGLNVEYQFYKSEGISMLGYLGGVVTYNITFYDFPSFSTDKLSPGSFIFGIPVGVEAKVPFNPKWEMIPFVGMTRYLGGIKIFTDGTEHIAGYTAPLVGADVLYKPWDLSLGAIFSQVVGGGNNAKNGTIQVSGSWRYGKDVKTPMFGSSK